MSDSKGICYIFGASELGDVRVLPTPRDFVIAADAGYRHCAGLGITPSLVVGDFDSLGATPEGENIERHPVDKDDTDVMLAVRRSLERGYGRFEIYGCLGGRLDHTLANIQVLTLLSRRYCSAVLHGADGSLITAVTDGEIELDGAGMGRVSVFCAGEAAHGVCLAGLKYPLDGAELSYEFPLGVSNYFAAERARVSVERGTLIIMIFPKEDIG